MNIRAVLSEYPRKLTATKSAFLDVQLLLMNVLNYSKEKIFSHSEDELTTNQLKKFVKLFNRRQKNEPIAYLLGKKEFFGNAFFVDKNVLIPRPETEILAETILKDLSDLSPKEKILLLDIGTGSACLIVSLVQELIKQKRNGRFIASDISAKAIKIAKKNAKKFNLNNKIKFFVEDLIGKKIQREMKKITFDKIFIVANLPYISPIWWKKLSLDIKNFEPRQAFVAQKQGTAIYQKLLKTILTLKKNLILNKKIQLYFEIDPRQKKYWEKYLRQNILLKNFIFLKDLSKKYRILKLII